MFILNTFSFLASIIFSMLSILTGLLSSASSSRHMMQYFKLQNTLNMVLDSEQVICNDLAIYKQIFTEKERILCYSISDLHADTDANLEWIHRYCIRKQDETDIFTVIILPGDIATGLSRLKQIFGWLLSQYDLVCFCCGNHELWCKEPEVENQLEDEIGDVGSIETHANMPQTSITKFNAVLLLAQRMGVCIGPVQIQSKLTPDKVLSIAPLQSWYHSSWDTEPDITNKEYVRSQNALPFMKMWSDFYMCNWPENLISKEDFVTTNGSSTILAQHFAALNEPFLKSVEASKQSDKSDTIISFSHFVPRQELCPEKRFLVEPSLSRVIGSDYLESQIRRLKSDFHLFGHTHVPIDLVLDGTRYIQWPLGYRREAKYQCSPIFRFGPIQVYDSSLHATGNKGAPSNLPSETLSWSMHYKYYERSPELTEDIAPWVQSRINRYSGLVNSILRESRNE